MEIQDTIYKLLWDKRHVQIPDEISVPEQFRNIIIKDPTLEDRNMYLIAKDREIKISKAAGVPSEEEIFENARLSGYWTDEDDYVIKNANDKIAELQDELDRCKFTFKKKQLKKDIETIHKSKKIVENKMSDLRSNSAEYLANEVSIEFLLRRVCVSFDDQKLIWKNDEEFLDFKNQYPQAFVLLLHAVLSEGVLPSKEIREVARSLEWRLTWVLNRENLESIFNKKIGDLNLNQRLLIYWSRVYDSAIESMEPPSSDVVSDDDKFDDWLISRKNDATNPKSKQSKASGHQEQMTILDGEYIEVCTCGVGSQNGVPLTKRRCHNISCKYGTYKKYSNTEREAIAQQVYARNSDSVRSHINNEQNKVDRHKLIPEEQLRDKRARTLLGLNTKIFKPK